MSLLWRTAMAWHDGSGTAEEMGAKPSRSAGFKGYVGYEGWEMNEPENENLDGFDEDLWDKVRPAPLKNEKPNRDGDLPPSHHRRHEQAYLDALEKRNAESEPDIEDDDLHDFVRSHGSNTSLWQNKGTLGKVDISKGVYATQSHVGQKHIDRYLANPDEETWHRKTFPTKPPVYYDDGKPPKGLRGPNFDSAKWDREHPRRQVEPAHYLGDESPMFVTHQGRLHCTEGHHRVAAALQRGDTHIVGWHYDGDKHGLPRYDEDGD